MNTFLVFSTYSQNIKSKNIIVELNQSIREKIATEDDYNELLLYNLSSTPNYKKKVMETCIGIPKNDSIDFYGQLDNVNVLYDLYKVGDLTEEKYIQYLKEEKIDTLNFSKIKLKRQLNIIVGFDKNKQFIIADVNHNNDFSDDLKYEFDINIRKRKLNKDEINKLPVTQYIYEEINKGIIYKHSRKFILYPDVYNKYYLNYNIKEREYLSVIKLLDNWKGKINLDNKKFDVVFDGLDSKKGVLYIKPIKQSFSKYDVAFNEQYKYNIGDTLKLCNKLYKIDSINIKISKLYLNFISKSSNNFGSSINNYLKNIKFADIKNEEFNLKDIFKTKKYNLIEFWGTWCYPCIEMTPKLIDLYSRNKDKLNIISFAVDKNMQNVQEYIKEHNIDWINSFLIQDFKSKNSIQYQFNIKFYPTFILVNSKGKILSRGSIDTFDTIKKLIK